MSAPHAPAVQHHHIREAIARAQLRLHVDRQRPPIKRHFSPSATQRALMLGDARDWYATYLRAIERFQHPGQAPLSAVHHAQAADTWTYFLRNLLQSGSASPVMSHVWIDATHHQQIAAARLEFEPLVPHVRDRLIANLSPWENVRSRLSERFGFAPPGTTERFALDTWGYSEVRAALAQDNDDEQAPLLVDDAALAVCLITHVLDTFWTIEELEHTLRALKALADGTLPLGIRPGSPATLALGTVAVTL